ncbi:archaetidylserine decarboxylase [Candidatus Schneideria nysicola]|uniref:archaetidylserine decarboxylase n=1 Tax=Candidatus Schneideria nysicola TaxID=1081631 RepID=UPI001CAA617C|nr:archaetidylserine decarboxylase [Candidatus Schneideria nysicola]UAJ65880.1 phosphatidylserine decarboxylase [Candidatus Schneideria nysicola]
MLEKIIQLTRRWITELVGWLAQKKGKWITYFVIFIFIRIYKINMKESLEPNITAYSTFNNFFSRKLKKEVRLIDTNLSTIVSPVDGTISQLGLIKVDNSIQAKNYPFSLTELLVEDYDLINYFYGGSLITIYLSPRDYHRVHMPCDGVLRKVIYVPGNLFSVNPNKNNIPTILSKNERLICIFDTDFGLIAQILIGAIIVGSIVTIWSGTLIPPRGNNIKIWEYPQKTIQNNTIYLKKGQEMGYFQMGSTVINLFPKKTVVLKQRLYKNAMVQFGQVIAKGMK